MRREKHAERAKPQVLVHNEKTKIRATFFNSLAVSAFTLGAAAPFAGYLIGSIQGNPLPSAVIWLLGGCGLHLAALTALEEMKEP